MRLSSADWKPIFNFGPLPLRWVQQYGFLLPKLNPDSDPGKEHQFLFQERTKWLAQINRKNWRRLVSGESETRRMLGSVIHTLD